MPDTEFQAEHHELEALYDRDLQGLALLTNCIAGDKAAMAQLSKIQSQSQNPCQGQSHSQSQSTSADMISRRKALTDRALDANDRLREIRAAN
jgi:hypothetical protein